MPFHGPAFAEDVYQTPQAFLDEIFAGNVPVPQLLWLTGDKKETVREILGAAPDSIRVRYWQQGNRTAWILEAIGKERPITTGYVVADGRIEQLRVLIFRESRGWEVRYPFFTDQFNGAALSEKRRLTLPIDNVSGATLSVNALTRLARLALYYDSLVASAHDTAQTHAH